jgi:hypothetical protein
VLTVPFLPVGCDAFETARQACLVPVTFRPITPDLLVTGLAALLVDAPVPGVALRVAVDGADAAGPVELARQLVAPLRAAGRPAYVVTARTFWRDASLRLEYGREDVTEYLQWLDRASLRREVLDPLGPEGSGTFLPSLRDPVTNRATRERARVAAPGEIVVVAGSFLLRPDLPFDVRVHLTLSAGALRRRTPPAEGWTRAAHARYAAQVRPEDTADVVVRLDDPARPAVRGL